MIDPVVIQGSPPSYWSNAGAVGLLVSAGDSSIRGLIINSFDGAGILLEGGGNNVIQGNILRTDAAGSSSSIGNDWARDHVGARVENLHGGYYGSNGGTWLTIDTVHDDGATDVLRGSSGSDWFVYGFGQDHAIDIDANELAVALTSARSGITQSLPGGQSKDRDQPRHVLLALLSQRGFA